YKIGDGVTAWNDLKLRGFDGTLVQTTGDSENAAMSQKAVTSKLTELESHINNYKPIVINGNVTNAADEEDITSEGNLLKLKNRLALNGMGYVILRKNKSFASQVTQSNTIYEIRYDIDLGGAAHEIPDNCVLRFAGGSLSNGNLVFNKTHLDGNVKIDNILPSGSIANYEVRASWFGVSSQKDDNHAVLQSLVNMVDCLIIEDIYKISKSLTISRKVSLRGLRDKEHVYAISEGSASCGIKITSNAHCIILDDNAKIEVRALALLGNKDLYVANDTHEDVMMAGIYQNYKGAISVFDRSSIMGFTYGIYSVGAHITEITNSWFSACRFGLYTKYTSDYSVTGCSFNTCMLNYDHQSHSLANNDPYSIKNIGGGVKVVAGGMIKFVANRFEWNFINFIIDEMAVQMLVNDNIFDAATYTHILISNPLENHSIDLSNLEYAIDGLTFANNAINKGAGLGDWLAGESIFYIESRRDRKLRFSLIGNVVADEIGDVTGTNRQYETKLFSLFVAKIGECTIVSEGNDFARCKASVAFSAVDGSSGTNSFVYKDTGSDFGGMSHRLWHNIFDVQKMEVLPDHTIKIWNTYSDGSAASQDIIFNPVNPVQS
ncbi:MAG: hypothetical protein U0K36_07175, partial [Bacteroidales bacterium]|nr:hypothetical protein [Bacteroidales bacterium]